MPGSTNSINNSAANLSLLSNTGILDSNGNSLLSLSPTANAVNYLVIANSAEGNGPSISAATTGSDTSIDIHLALTYTGIVYIDGGGLVLSQSSAYLTMTDYPTITADTIANRLVQQQTSFATAITCNQSLGVIQIYSNNYSANTMYTITLNNTYIVANSVVLVSLQDCSLGTPFLIDIQNTSVGSCVISIFWIGGSSGSSGACTLNISFGVF
jgi:hypothetical protein